MIHSASRSCTEAFAGVELLNQPQRVSDFSTSAVPGERGCPLTKAAAIRSKEPMNINWLLSLGLYISFYEPQLTGNPGLFREGRGGFAGRSFVHALYHSQNQKALQYGPREDPMPAAPLLPFLGNLVDVGRSQKRPPLSAE